MSSWAIYVGYDPREADAFAVCAASIERHLSVSIPIYPLVLRDLREAGLYWRPQETRTGPTGFPILWDVLSEAPMATEFAISRFLVPHIARGGLALFLDCDMLARTDLVPVFADFDQSKAVACVKHPNYRPADTVKMDGQLQTFYARKNWTSFIVFNCDHSSNSLLTIDDINQRPGRDLHALYWLGEAEIAGLDPTYNHLVGEVPYDPSAKVVHWTNGGPWFPKYADAPFSDEWRAQRAVIQL